MAPIHIDIGMNKIHTNLYNKDLFHLKSIQSKHMSVSNHDIKLAGLAK